MAIDTTEKINSLLTMTTTRRPALPISPNQPQFSTQDLQHMLHGYRGIAWEGPAQPTEIGGRFLTLLVGR